MLVPDLLKKEGTKVKVQLIVKIQNFQLLKLLNLKFSIVIYLSLIFNKILEKVLNVGVKDLTSGFIVGKKSYFSEDMFRNFEGRRIFYKAL